MLIGVNKFDRNKSKYTCDRCKIELLAEERFVICVGHKFKAPKKKWDLCKKCYRAFAKAIEKGVKK